MQSGWPSFRKWCTGVRLSLWTFKLEFGIVHAVNCSVCRSSMPHVAVANHSGDNASCPTSIAQAKALMNAAHAGDGSALATVRSFCSVMHEIRTSQRTALHHYVAEHWRSPSRVSSAPEFVVSGNSSTETASQPPVTPKPATTPLTPSGLTLHNTAIPTSTTTHAAHNASHPTSIAQALTLMSAAHAGNTTALETIRAFCSVMHQIPTNQRTELHHYVAEHWRSPPRVSSAPTPEFVVSGNSSAETASQPLVTPKPATTPLTLSTQTRPNPAIPTSSATHAAHNASRPTSIAKLKALMSAAHAGNATALETIRSFCSVMHQIPTNQRTELHHYVVEHWRSPSKVASTSKPRVQLAKTSSSVTPKPEKPSLTCALSSSNPSTSDQQSPSVEPPAGTNVSTAKVPRGWAQLGKASSSATSKPEKPSPTCVLSSSNPSTSDQQSSSVEPPGETTANVPKRQAQLAKASSSATPKPAKPSPRPSTCPLSSSNTSDQQSSSVEPPGETNASTSKVPKSWAQLAKASSSATHKPEKLSPRPPTCPLTLSNPSSKQQSSSVLTNRSPRPLATIAHLDALMKAAHSGDNSSLTRIRTFCGTAHRTPRKQRTELQRHALLYWRNRSPSVSSSVPSSVPSSELGTVHTTVGDGTFSTEIHVDSAGWGVGFVMDGLWLAWKFSDSSTLSGNSIDNNCAEMLAVEVGLWTVIHWVRNVIQKEGDVIEPLEIIVCSDNAGVVKAFEKRHSNYPPQQDILLRILDMISEYDIKLSMKWIASMDNLADGPSRGVPGPAPDLLPFIPPLPSHLSDTLVLP